MSHSHPIQDSSVPYGLNLGAPLNDSTNTQFKQNEYPTTTGNTLDHAAHSHGAGIAQQYSATHPSTGFNNSTFPQESDTLSRGEAGQFGSESQARRNEGLVNAASEEGVTHGGFVSDRRHPEDPSDATLAGHQHGHQHGVVGGHSSQSYEHGRDYSSNENEYGHQHQHRGNHQPGNPHPENIKAHEQIKDSNPTGRDVTIAGFNPKDTHNIDSKPAQGEEVERISTDGPHGLVWLSAERKYVHRRELEGDRHRSSRDHHREESRDHHTRGESSTAHRTAVVPAAVPVANQAHVSQQPQVVGVPVAHQHQTPHQQIPYGVTSSSAIAGPHSRDANHPTPAAAMNPSAGIPHNHAVGISPAGTESHNSTTSNYDGRPAENHAHNSSALNKIDPRVHESTTTQQQRY